MSGHRIVFFDLETGGTDPKRHPIIQLAAISIDPEDWREVESLERKLRFDVSRAEPEALKGNHYDEMTWLREAVEPAAARKAFSEFLRRNATIQMIAKTSGRPYKVARLAGHNIATFDVPFIETWYDGQFIPAHFKVFDTMQLAVWIHGWPLPKPESEPENMKLSGLMAHHGIERRGEAHEALSDVRGASDLAKTLVSYVRGLQGECAR